MNYIDVTTQAELEDVLKRREIYDAHQEQKERVN